MDTQARTHTLAVLAAPTGEVIEGVTTYGALLASLVADTGYQAAEAPRMSARENQEQAGRTRLLLICHLSVQQTPMCIKKLTRRFQSVWSASDDAQSRLSFIAAEKGTDSASKDTQVLVLRGCDAVSQ